MILSLRVLWLAIIDYDKPNQGMRTCPLLYCGRVHIPELYLATELGICLASLSTLFSVGVKPGTVSVEAMDWRGVWCEA